ncbi:hypothetical protein [Streptomyces sp. SBT349]|uniref:hypothetical protein n=1 Tax=Streptomyces sp. SBT349 TaxID=1580539 RepID=UPI00066D582A|nr:hypothetical protein [Streptomyces sp. SBT349]
MTGQQLQLTAPVHGTVNPAAGEAAGLDDQLAAFIDSVSDWDKALIEQAINIFGAHGRPFSMNTFRDLLPEMAHGTAGLVFLSMANRKPPPIVEIGKVRSTSGPTHKKEIGLYVLREFSGWRAAA